MCQRKYYSRDSNCHQLIYPQWHQRRQALPSENVAIRGGSNCHLCSSQTLYLLPCKECVYYGIDCLFFFIYFDRQDTTKAKLSASQQNTYTMFLLVNSHRIMLSLTVIPCVNPSSWRLQYDFPTISRSGKFECRLRGIPSLHIYTQRILLQSDTTVLLFR